MIEDDEYVQKGMDSSERALNQSMFFARCRAMISGMGWFTTIGAVLGCFVRFSLMFREMSDKEAQMIGILIFLVGVGISYLFGRHNVNQFNHRVNDIDTDIKDKITLQYDMHLVTNPNQYPKLFQNLKTACDQLDLVMPSVYLIDNDLYDDFDNIIGFIDNSGIPCLIITQALIDDSTDTDLQVLMMNQLMMMDMNYSNWVIKEYAIHAAVGHYLGGYVLMLLGCMFMTGVSLILGGIMVPAYFISLIIINGHTWQSFVVFEQIKGIQRVITKVTGDDQALQMAYDFLFGMDGHLKLTMKIEDVLGMMWMKPINLQFLTLDSKYGSYQSKIKGYIKAGTRSMKGSWFGF